VADGQGNEAAAPLHDEVSIQLDGAEKSDAQFVTLSQPRQSVTVETDFPPNRLVLDPSYHLFDRERENNSCEVS
jgi:hypothetical protein